MLDFLFSPGGWGFLALAIAAGVIAGLIALYGAVCVVSYIIYNIRRKENRRR